jgi:hypothetical protein
MSTSRPVDRSRPGPAAAVRTGLASAGGIAAVNHFIGRPSTNDYYAAFATNEPLSESLGDISSGCKLAVAPPAGRLGSALCRLTPVGLSTVFALFTTSTAEESDDFTVD